MSNVKIAFLGAGSVRYTLKLIGDIAKTQKLNGTTVYLMDIDRESLDVAENLSKRYVNEIEADVKIEKTINREEALDGAKFIINTAFVKPEGFHAGYVHYEIMRDVGEKHGYYRGIDSQEFNMVSDYYTFTNYNQLKLSLDIAKSVEKIAPDAWLIQTANPVFEITQLVRRLTNVNIVGFCHGVKEVHNLFETLGLDEKDIDWQIAGVNHGIWLNRFLYKGKDAYPILDKWIEEKLPTWEPKDHWDMQMSPAAMDMYKFYKMLPIGDTVRNGTWKHHYNIEAKKKWFGKFGGIDNEIERPKFYEELDMIRKETKRVAKDPSIKLTELYPSEFSKDKLSGEQQIPFINALTNGEKARLFLNIPNNGIINGIPDNIVVEAPMIVDENGLHPEKIEPDLTERIKKFYIAPRIMRMEMALEAFITGDRSVLEEVLFRDPRTKSEEQVKAVWDEILDLPFNEEMKKHYRG